MADGPLLYYISDRKAFPGDESARRRRLLEKIAEAARCGVDYIQLREKDLSSRELESLACEAVCTVRNLADLRTENRGLRTHLLINSRTDVALAAGADGVHLRSDDVSPSDVCLAWRRGAGGPRRETFGKKPIIGISCHSVTDVTQAAENLADFVVFAPVFEKRDSAGTRPTGLCALQAACRVQIPVLALGGVTLANAQACLDAGATGIAAIGLFQNNDLAEVVRTIRG